MYLILLELKFSWILTYSLNTFWERNEILSDKINKICSGKSRVHFLLLVKKPFFYKWITLRDLTRDFTPKWRQRLSRRLLGDNAASQMRKHDETAENLHAVLLLPSALIKTEAFVFISKGCLLLDVCTCWMTFPFLWSQLWAANARLETALEKQLGQLQVPGSVRDWAHFQSPFCFLLWLSVIQINETGWPKAQKPSKMRLLMNSRQCILLFNMSPLWYWFMEQNSLVMPCS